MRTRSRSTIQEGSLTGSGLSSISRLAVRQEQFVDDVSQPYEPGRLMSSNRVYKSGTLSGTASAGRIANTYAPLHLEVTQPPTMTFSRESLELVLTKHMASANPSSSDTNYSETIAELPKLPEMFKFTGDTFLKTYGSAFLNTTFGWAPLLGDLANFILVAADTDAMFERIARLSRKEDFTSKRTLERKSTTINHTDIVLNSLGIWVMADSVTDMSVYGHTFVRYKPDPSGVPPSAEAQRVLAYTAAKGLQLGFYEAWQLVPWAWLVDWSFNVSEYLKANRNVLGATCTESYAAVKAVTEIRYHNIGKPNGLEWDTLPRQRRETQQRIPLNPTILPTMPAMSPGRIGILSALIAKWV